MRRAYVLYKFALTRRFKANLVYALAVAALIFMFMAFLDTIQQNAPQIQAIFEAFGSDFLRAFGTDAQRLTTVEGYFSSRIGFLLVIVGGISAVYAGVTTIAGEIANNTMVFLTTKPISRKTIYWLKVVAIATHYLWVNAFLCFCSVLSVEIFTQESGIDHLPFFINVFVGILIIQLNYLGLGFVLGSLLSYGKALPAGIGFVVGAYAIDVLSKISKSVADLKYFTPNYYVDLEYITSHGGLRPEIWLLVLVAWALLFIGFIGFLSRDLES